MREITFAEIAAMKGNGSSMRTVLKNFIDKGAKVYLLYEDAIQSVDRFFLVRLDGLTIPLRARKLNFYSVYNSALSHGITSDKLKSQSTLEAWDVPVPATLTFSNDDQARDFLAHHGSVVVKPRKGSHGEGITVNVTDNEVLDKAVTLAKTVHDEVLLQQRVSGEDHRLLFIDYKFVAAVRRVPASVVGNGEQTVGELVEAYNTVISQRWRDVRSGTLDADNVRGSMSKMSVEEIIAARGEEILCRIPSIDERVSLLDKANVSLGGQTKDVTDDVNRELTDRISELLYNIDLPLCGVDVLSTDITSSLTDKQSYVIELNAAPGLRLHEAPMEGESRPVCDMVAESLIRHYRQLQSAA